MHKRFTSLLVVMLIAAAVPLVAAPEDRQVDQPTVADTPGNERVYVVDQAIVRDEKTGAMRKPTPQETADLVRTLKGLTSTSTANLEVTTAADGTEKADLGGGFNMVILVRPTAEGGTETLCVSTFEEAAEFLGIRLEREPKAEPKARGAQR